MESSVRAVLLLVITLLEGSEAVVPPHLVLVYVDDMGYSDVSWHNSYVKMPNIEALAEEGVVLEHAYAQEVCTPSRAALLTGYYPIRIGMQEKVVTAKQTSGLPLSLTLLPQYLKQQANYTSYMVGKWHLGFCSEDYTPLQRGFSSHYGFYNGHIGYYDHSVGESGFAGLDYRNNTEVNSEATGRYTTSDFTDAAISMIENHDPDEPMFLYMSYNTPHSPYEVDASYLSLYPEISDGNRKTYLGMISALDDEVLRLVNSLKDKGLWNNTVFVFYSDNGGPAIPNGESGINYPLRGRKSTLFEGGYRVPAFITSELLNNKGYVHDGLIHITDLFATFIYLANDKDANAIPSDIDGLNIWEAISDNTASPRTEMVYNIITKATSSSKRSNVDPQAAVRFQDFKLIEGDPGTGNTHSVAEWVLPPENNTDVIGTFPNIGSYDEGGVQYYLFNLADDPYETNNLASTDPTNLYLLQRKLRQAKRTVVQAIDSTTTDDANPSNFGGAWSPGFC